MVIYCVIPKVELTDVPPVFGYITQKEAYDKMKEINGEEEKMIIYPIEI